MPMSRHLGSVPLAALLALGLLSPGMAMAQQGDVIRPKPRTTEQSLVQPRGHEPKPATVEVRAIGDLKIGFVPFFSADDSLDEKGSKAFGKWLKKSVKTLLKDDAFDGVDDEWIDRGEIDDSVFETLPRSRIREAASLLKPLAVEGLDGVMAGWLEDKGDSYDLVVAFYLANRLRFESYRLSANFERSTLAQEAEGGFSEDRTRELMVELVRRNLNRVLPVEAPAHHGGGSAGESSSGESKAPGGVEGSDDNGAKPAEQGAGGPAVLAVFDFSKELSSARESLSADYLKALQGYDFGEMTRATLTQLLGSKRAVRAANPRAISYDQIEAPVIDLDPDADPKAREKALFSRAGPDADALVLGHVKSARSQGRTVAQLHVRLLRRAGYQYFQAYRDLGKVGSWGEDTLERIMLDLLKASGIYRPSSSQFQVLVQPSQTASEIAVTCYSGRLTTERVESLCRVNNYPSVDACKIKKGEIFMVPKELISWQLNGHSWKRDDKACRRAQRVLGDD